MRFLRRSLVGLFLMAATVGLLVFAGQMVWGALQAKWSEEPRQRAAEERVFAVNTVTVTPATIAPELATFGEIASRRTLELRASTAGTVVWLADGFEEGGEVAAGELLVRIDPADAQSARDTAAADLAEAEADLDDARRAVELAREDVAAAENQADLQERAAARQRDLSDRGVGSASAVEQAELSASSARQSVLSRRQSLASAEARAAQAETALSRFEIALAEAERRLAETEIEAAFAGVLSNVGVSLGALVSQNETLGEIVDPTALEVAFRVSTPQYARLLDGDGRLVTADVTVALDVLGYDLSTTGRITRSSASVGEGQTGRLLYASLDRPAGLKPGDFVTVTIVEPALDRVARLPATALDSANTVLALGDEDRLRVEPVELLRRVGDDVIVRADGLDGRQVVAQRTPLLGAGIKVRVLSPDGAEAPAEEEMVELDADRRARLVAFVEQTDRMPQEAKDRVLGALQGERVPASMVARIEERMGG